MENTITVLSITAIACVAVYFLGDGAKDVVIAAVGGLCGYLTKGVVSPAPGKK